MDGAEQLEWCDRLGLSAVGIRPLTAGRSGATVLEVRLSGGDAVVVKVTSRAECLTAARRELRVLRALASRRVASAPCLVAATSGADGVAVAMQRCEPLGSATDAPDALWVEAAVAVARVHLPAGGALAAAVERRDARRERPHSPLPQVLEHGDCHLDNVVRDPAGRLVLVDWQDARLGDGLADLVFCWQRAEFAGARPPRAAMTEAYAAERGLAVASLVPLLDRTELRLLTEEWPPHLAQGSDAGRGVMAARLVALTRGQDVRR